MTEIEKLERKIKMLEGHCDRRDESYKIMSKRMNDALNDALDEATRLREENQRLRNALADKVVG